MGNPLGEIKLNIIEGAAEQWLYEAGTKLTLTKYEVDVSCALFRHFDSDGSGEIEINEFEKIIEILLQQKMKPLLLKNYAKMAFQQEDANKSGAIDLQEFLTVFAAIIKKENIQLAAGDHD